MGCGVSRHGRRAGPSPWGGAAHLIAASYCGVLLRRLIAASYCGVLLRARPGPLLGAQPVRGRRRGSPCAEPLAVGHLIAAPYCGRAREKGVGDASRRCGRRPLSPANLSRPPPPRLPATPRGGRSAARLPTQRRPSPPCVFLRRLISASFCGVLLRRPSPDTPGLVLSPGGSIRVGPLRV